MFTKLNFEKMYYGSWYTIIGCGGDITEWINGYTKMLEEQKIGTPLEWMTFSGAEINKYYDLTGYTRYSDDLICLAFSLDDLDIDRLAIFKFLMRDRWWDDAVDDIVYYNRR